MRADYTLDLIFFVNKWIDKIIGHCHSGGYHHSWGKYYIIIISYIIKGPFQGTCLYCKGSAIEKHVASILALPVFVCVCVCLLEVGLKHYLAELCLNMHFVFWGLPLVTLVSQKARVVFHTKLSQSYGHGCSKMMHNNKIFQRFELSTALLSTPFSTCSPFASGQISSS